MTHLVRVKLIRKALKHYTRDLPDEEKNTIKQCTDVVQFGMKSTLVQFRGKYYVYRKATREGGVADKYVVLATGTYKSAFLADIIASYVFKKREECFRVGRFRGIYCNNGLVTLTGTWVMKDI
eukprot:3901143-Ditylum_brightwellii.AAC.1